jgi:hypothetical protein
MLWLAVMAAGLLVPPGAGAYEVITVREGGTVAGKVVFVGSPPPKRKIVPTKDREVCGSGIREVDQIALGPDRAVAEAIVFLKGIERGKAWPRPAKTPVIDNVKCEFQPPVQVIAAGDVDIVNSDPVLHNTKAFYGRVPAFNVALPHQGQRITKALKRPGLVRVECDAHGWMLGWVHVADNPYYAVTGRDGTFALTEIPPGAYTLVVWQAFTGAVEVPVTVKARETTTVTVELKK